jgi:hypothetical protein
MSLRHPLLTGACLIYAFTSFRELDAQGTLAEYQRAMDLKLSIASR